MAEITDLLKEFEVAAELREEPPVVDEPIPVRDAPYEFNPTGKLPSNEEPENPEPKIKTRIDHELTARQFVEFFSSALEIGGKTLYPRYMLEEGDAEKLRETNRIIRLSAPVSPDETLRQEIEKDQTLADVVLRFERFQKAVEGAPLSQEEKTMLIDPLATVIEKYHFLQAGPELILFMVVVVIMTPRILPLFPGFASLLTDGLKKAVKP